MKIGVISDTHFGPDFTMLPKKLKDGLEGVDLIIHAGDITTIKPLKELKSIARVEAVRGNMDSREVSGVLPRKRVLRIEDVSVGIIHGYGAPAGLEERVLTEFDNVGIVIFGHSHLACDKRLKGVRLFNPGSPTDTVIAPFRSFGMLYVNRGQFRSEIIRL